MPLALYNGTHTLVWMQWIDVLETLVLKATSQENINPAVPARFLPDAYFARSVARRPIFLTLNNVVNSPSGCLTAAGWRLFGHRLTLSANDKIFGRCPADVTVTMARGPSGDIRGSCRSPPDDNESCDHQPFTFWWPCGHRRELHWCALGSILKLIFDFHMFITIVSNFHY